MVDELAPAGGEQVAPRSSAIDVTEFPDHAVNVGDGQGLHRRLSLVVQRRKD